MRICKIKCSCTKTSECTWWSLTRLLGAFLGVCMYRGVRPPGAIIEETSGTLGVTEKTIRVVNGPLPKHVYD